MRSAMTGRESRLATTPNCAAYWAAASLSLDEAELEGRLDGALLAPCISRLQRGEMAGFRCKAKLLRVIVGDGLWHDDGLPASRSLSTASEMIGPVRSYLPKLALRQALEGNVPIKMLLLVKVCACVRACVRHAQTPTNLRGVLCAVPPCAVPPSVLCR